jgi:hypothetical protein
MFAIKKGKKFAEILEDLLLFFRMLKQLSKRSASA